MSHAPNRLIVKPKPGCVICVADYIPGARLLRIRRNGMQMIGLPEGYSVEQCCYKLRHCYEVEYVEPDYILTASLVPDDTRFGDLWGLKNTGQDGGTVGADISAETAWDIRTDAANIIVAVIDTGILLSHEDLAGNLWANPDETADGTDTDGNGYVDDVNGINAIDGSGDPNDDNGHGTHVAGIIGAVGNNATGVTGVAWKVQLMALKFLGLDGTGLTSNAIECIDYAIENGAHIINASWGSNDFSQALKDAFNDARTAGILVVASAGNDGVDIDATPHYPASLDLDNILVAGATDRDDQVTAASNYGEETVHVGAPGKEIISTWFDGDYSSQDGTSMSAGYVSGACALLMGHYSNEDYRLIKGRVIDGADAISSMSGLFQSGGRMNLRTSLVLTPTQRVFAKMSWPSDFPLPYVDYSGDPRYPNTVSPVRNANILRRSRFETSYATAQVRWIMDVDQYEKFKVFYGDQLGNGNSSFTIQLRYPKNSVLTEWLVAFLEGFQATYHEGLWEVRASLDLKWPVILDAMAALSGFLAFKVTSEDSGGGFDQFVTSDGFRFMVKGA